MENTIKKYGNGLHIPLSKKDFNEGDIVYISKENTSDLNNDLLLELNQINPDINKAIISLISKSNNPNPLTKDDFKDYINTFKDGLNSLSNSLSSLFGEMSALKKEVTNLNQVKEIETDENPFKPASSLKNEIPDNKNPAKLFNEV